MNQRADARAKESRATAPATPTRTAADVFRERQMAHVAEIVSGDQAPNQATGHPPATVDLNGEELSRRVLQLHGLPKPMQPERIAESLNVPTDTVQAIIDQRN